MNKLIVISAACLTLIACQLQTDGTMSSGALPDGAVKVVSLREGNQLSHISRVFPNRAIKVEEGGIDVSFDDQPPMIPHEVKMEDERITLNRNECLTCHSKEGASDNKDAGKAPKSHFIDRNDEKTAKIAARRYFCTQCHYTQQDKMPVIKNNYHNPDA